MISTLDPRIIAAAILTLACAIAGTILWLRDRKSDKA